MFFTHPARFRSLRGWPVLTPAPPPVRPAAPIDQRSPVPPLVHLRAAQTAGIVPRPPSGPLVTGPPLRQRLWAEAGVTLGVGTVGVVLVIRENLWISTHSVALPRLYIRRS